MKHYRIEDLNKLGYNYISELNEFKVTVVHYEPTGGVFAMLTKKDYKISSSSAFECNIYHFEKKTDEEKFRETIDYDIKLLERKHNIKIQYTKN